MLQFLTAMSSELTPAKPTTTIVKAEQESMVVNLRGQDGSEVHFKVRQNVEFRKVKRMYAKRIGLPVEGLRFLLDGKRIEDKETPSSLEMDISGNNVIEVYFEQTGGH